MRTRRRIAGTAARAVAMISLGYGLSGIGGSLLDCPDRSLLHVRPLEALERHQLTVTRTAPALSGARRWKASPNRSMMCPPPHAHQSTSWTLIHEPLPQTWTTRPLQFPTRRAGPAAA